MAVLSYEVLNEINEILQERDDESAIKGAVRLLEALEVNARVQSPEQAKELIKATVYRYLDKEDYLSAATLMFGFDYFDCRSPHIHDMFRIAREEDKIIPFGASSMSKSYCLGIWLVCDYLRDPHYTNIIVASVGETHLKGNLFSGLINAVNSAVIDTGLETNISSMSIKPKGAKTLDVGIYGRAFPQDKNYSTGRLRGIKPMKRIGKAHPTFGKMGRVRILLDEASSIPEGVYKDFGSAMASGDGEGRVKFFVAFNPTIVEHWTTEIAKPVGGIEVIDEDKDIEWTSERGWKVYRLDGMRSPNVIAKKEVCAGVMTWSAMKDKISSGENSMDYWVYGRGMWMRKGHFSNVMPMDYLTNNRGEFIFPEGSENVASVDLAFVEDKVIFTLGRWGVASGFIQANGQREMFMYEGRQITRHSLQIDQQFEINIPSSDSIKLANEIIRLCRELKVKPEWLVVDRTGIGAGTFDNISTYFGSALGVQWANGSTDIKILAEDDTIPNAEYANIGTEMWFTMRRWLEHGIIKLGLSIPANPLFTELTTRRYKGRGSRVIVESKTDYKARAAGGQSSDRSDSLIQLPHLCRVRGDYLPSVSGRREAAGTFDVRFDPSMLVSSETDDDGLSLMDVASGSGSTRPW